jgi:uncharacterized protein (DUF433 family)
MPEVSLDVDLSKYIDNSEFGDRPHIRGRRITIAQIADTAANQSWDLDTVANEYTLTKAQVLAALLYYEEFREQVDALEAANEAD